MEVLILNSYLKVPTIFYPQHMATSKLIQWPCNLARDGALSSLVNCCFGGNSVVNVASKSRSQVCLSVGNQFMFCCESYRKHAIIYFAICDILSVKIQNLNYYIIF